ncbi:MAG: Holliday junction branch migration protein RuvA [Myxococcaceae bacterium]|nr:MAG: Holliday junction branch migration protein RuvA [Myxococcaceae bacterium]
MIASLHGTVLEKSQDEAIIEVAGVGYRVAFSVLTLGRLPPVGEPVRVRVRTVVREDAFELFGFLTPVEEAMFNLLTSVSHVGPRLAMTVLSGLEVDELVVALERGEVARLTRIHGVGRKTAERLVLELKDKVKVLPRSGAAPAPRPSDEGARSDLVSALANLGYRPAQAEAAAEAALAKLGAAELEALLREALRALRTAT